MSEAVFLRLLETEDKAAALMDLVRRSDARMYVVDAATFAKVPGSPMAYWVRETVLDVFSAIPRFTSGRDRFAVRGAYTTDDFRFYRLAWEVPLQASGRSGSRSYPPLVKGGSFSRFYYDPHLAVCWHDDGAIAKAHLSAYRKAKGWGEDWSACLNGYGEYFRPGLTWPRRTSGLSFRVMPAGCIFGDKGPAAFVAEDRPVALLALAAVLNSAAFGALVGLQLARTELAQSYEVGLIQQTPVPRLTPADESFLATHALEAWSLKRGLDTVIETSHAFLLPALLQVGGTSLSERAAAWALRELQTERRLAEIQAAIDDRCFALYGIDAADRASIERGFGHAEEREEPEVDSEPDEDAGEEELSGDDAVAALLSWCIGAAFGRFDVLVAMGRLPAPVTPDPFAPLPPCSAGMLTGEDFLPVPAPTDGHLVSFPEDGILVDDPGAARDLPTRIRHVFACVFGEGGAERLDEARDVVAPGAADIRPWLRVRFFEAHIKRYSKSRRKAPIYWQLGTASGSYSVWLYVHRVGPDTIHAVLRDHVEPKLRFEENQLAILTSAAGATPTPAQRREVAAQEAFVVELRAFRDELMRVVPLWHPDLDDGVVINASFLHRLFPHQRAWAKECESHWEKLKAGDYDWAHLAMRLWPERVLPKCADDRSLAIAHGLEELLWFEDEDGKWQPRGVDPDVVEKLVRDRSSSAVKDALRQVANAPPPARPPRGAGSAVRAAKQGGSAPTPTRAKQLPLELAPVVGVDETALDALRAALHQFPDGAGKAELLAASGLDEGQWGPAISALTAAGEIERSGQKRGTRYALRAGGSS